MFIYVAGPIANMPSGNRELFREIEEDLKSKGYSPRVPFDIHPLHVRNVECPIGPLGDQEGFEHTAPCYMRGDIEWMMNSADAVVLIPGWINSSGARVEFITAQACGIPIYFALKGRSGIYRYYDTYGEELV